VSGRSAGFGAAREQAPAALETLWETANDGPRRRGAPLPDELTARYGGPLDVAIHPDRPTLLVNFVSSLDGVVALGAGEEPGGGVISGFFEPDRFVMALLRAIADVLLVGSGTIAGSSSRDWTAEHLEPDHATAFERWRRDLGLAPKPMTAIVTGSGDVRLGRRGVDDPSVPVVFVTTQRGARRLAEIPLPSHVRVDVAGAGDELAPEDIATWLRQLGSGVVLSEGGPHLLGDLVAGDLADELFLTVAPQILGRGDPGVGRLGLVEGRTLSPDQARWFELASAKRAADHLFLRYRQRG
jgi:riboflavin biosynthesis pyrimidine reductase